MKLRLKKITASALVIMLCAEIVGQSWFQKRMNAQETTPVITQIPGTVKTEKEMDGSFLSVSGFASGKVNDRSQYKEGDAEYAVVENAAQFVEALDKAEAGTVKVIEIRSDLYMGWHELPEEVRKNSENSVLEMSPDTDNLRKVPVGNPITAESGISRITLHNADGLTIFSTQGHTIYHAEFKFNSGVNDLVIRNLEFDEIWEWEDWRVSGYGATGGRGDGTRNGWSFIKINGAHNVWIDHCNFGIAFDDNIGIENGASGVSITWCKFGDVDLSVGSMLYKTLQYMEALYQKSKIDENVKPFVMYSVMRDNGMTLEEIGKLMGYHSKCHMTGAGDKDTWLYKDADGNLVADTTKTNANELLRVTLAYNNYTSIGSRVPMIRSGVGHLYNNYTNNKLLSEVSDILHSDPMNTGKNIRQQIEEAGGGVHPLSRGMDARNGASIAADTCVYEYMENAIIGTAYHPNGTNISDGFADYWTYNYALIVNSSTFRKNPADTYIGSSWDNNGDNPFINSSTYYNNAENIIGNWSWGQEGDSLPYEYQTFPLEDVKENMDKYCGFRKIDMSADDWLKTTYADDYELKLVDTSKEIPITEIRLSKESATLYIEEEFLQLDAIVLPSNTTEKAAEYQWTSSNPEIATVNDAGLVLPVAPGKTTITVKTKAGLTASCEVNVSNLPESLAITEVPEAIYVGDILDLSAEISPTGFDNENVYWENSGIRMTLLDENKGIFRADEAGSNPIAVYSNLTGNRVGTKTATGRKTLKILKNTVPVTGVAVTSEVEVKVGTAAALNATVLPMNATSQRLLYEVSDSSIAVVDDTGMVMGLREGETKVTVTSVNGGYQKTSVIRVTSAASAPTPGTGAAVSVILGDANCDGKVELLDAQIALKVSLKILTPLNSKEFSFEATDVNKDNKITLEDAQLILKYALKIIKEF